MHENGGRKTEVLNAMKSLAKELPVLIFGEVHAPRKYRIESASYLMGCRYTASASLAWNCRIPTKIIFGNVVFRVPTSASGLVLNFSWPKNTDVLLALE
jgi:hypothetical protein